LTTVDPHDRVTMLRKALVVAGAAASTVARLLAAGLLDAQLRRTSGHHERSECARSADKLTRAYASTLRSATFFALLEKGRRPVRLGHAVSAPPSGATGLR
jgi:hypothetical protein